MEIPGENSWLPSLQLPKSNFAVVEPSGYRKSTFTWNVPPEVLNRITFLSACVMDTDFIAVWTLHKIWERPEHPLTSL